MTEDGRRTIDEKFEVQVFLVEKAAIAEASVAETAPIEAVPESVKVSRLGSGFAWGHLCL